MANNTTAAKPVYENPVFGYIVEEANAYKTRGVPLTDNWEWKMYEHIRRSFLYKHSKFADGENDGNRPFKNIVRPILNVAYRAEGFNVKDITPFVDNDKDYDKSFFVKKFADKWALAHSLDDFIDSMVEGFVDFGLTVVKRPKNKAPENVPLQRIEFCDQTDFMAGAKCELHSMTITEVNAMRSAWSEDAVKLAIEKARAGKMVILANSQNAKTPGKYIEVHELHGTFPETWLNDAPETDEYGEQKAQEYTDDTNYIRQIHLVGYYYDQEDNKCGIHFYKGPEPKEIYKAKKRDPIFGRACGFGGIEELFDPQQWTNYSEIQQKEMLDLATLILFQTSDEAFKSKNVLTDLEKGEVLVHDTNAPVTQVSITPQNMALFQAGVDRWNAAAQNIGSANEALLGQAPAGGTPFSLQALVVQQGFGLHDYRKGQLAVFMSEIYREWILPDLVRDMKKGKKFLTELSLDEMNGLVDNVVNILTKQQVIKLLTKGLMMTPAMQMQYQQQVKDGFMKGGSKKFVEILEGEIDQIPVDVSIDVANQQYDLNDRATKLTNIFRQVVANPQILQVPGMAKLFNEIIESSGFSPVDFSGITTAAPAAAKPALPTPVANANPQPQPAIIAQPQPVTA